MRPHKKYLMEICSKIDLDLNSSACSKLKSHLSKCPECAAYYDSLKRTIILYKNYKVKPSKSRVKQIMARLNIDSDIGKNKNR
jgi:predicted anti-sigma-YlaC factor YlaD